MTVVDHSEMLEVLLANSATWQTLSRAASVAEAQTSIHQYESDENASYPRATIMDDPLNSSAVSLSQFAGGGSLQLRFDLIPDVNLETRKARRAWVRQQLYTIKGEIEVLSNGRTTPTGYSVSHLVLRRLTMGDPYEQKQIDRPIGEGCDSPQFVWTCQFSVEY